MMTWVLVKQQSSGKTIGAVGAIGTPLRIGIVVSFYEAADGNLDGKVSPWPEGLAHTYLRSLVGTNGCVQIASIAATYPVVISMDFPFVEAARNHNLSQFTSALVSFAKLAQNTSFRKLLRTAAVGHLDPSKFTALIRPDMRAAILRELDR